ncbi:MAG: glucosamine-6-phosphate isomerase [Anaerolineaceae bacterium]|nr:glucosamine-6-phosphate isomerase [Anaerolineaceae bacterium]
MKLTQNQLTINPEELQSTTRIRFEVLPDPSAIFDHFARSIADEIQANNAVGKTTTLILPVGPIGQYPLLVDICNHERISWKNVHTFNMDEYTDWQGRQLPEGHPLSFRYYMISQFFNQLDEELRIPSDQIHFPDPLHLDAISQQIEILGGIDTCYGGIGYHGHIAFNEPPNNLYTQVSMEEFMESKTRFVHLNPDTLVMNSIWNTGGNPYNLPSMAVTIGFRDILAARRIRLYCSGGSWQRTVLRVALLSQPDVDYPVTLLQDHPDYAIISDLDTAQSAETSLF